MSYVRIPIRVLHPTKVVERTVEQMQTGTSEKEHREAKDCCQNVRESIKECARLIGCTCFRTNNPTRINIDTLRELRSTGCDGYVERTER